MKFDDNVIHNFLIIFRILLLNILFEDNHLLVLNKPAGLLTQPSGTDQDSLEQQAKIWIKTTYHKPGLVFLEATHRLDKPVSGVVVFARTSKALSRLNAAMRNKQTHKYYYALVEGMPPSKQGQLEHYLMHDDFCAQIVYKEHPQAKIARLNYKVIQETSMGALLEIELETGRYHQIRVQLKAIGCPIIGDKKYGSQLPFQPEAIALHHTRLVIDHPVTKKQLKFEAPLPWELNF